MKNRIIIIASFLIIAIAVCLCFYFINNYQKDIVLLTCEGTVNDNSFVGLAWSGLEELKDKANITYVENTETDKFKQTFEGLVAQKPDLIWNIEAASAETTKELAQANKDILFINMDTKYDVLTDNLIGVSFKSYESAFLAGYLAAKVSQTNTVGFIGGKDETVIHEFENGFVAGVKYANPEVNILVNYAGTYSDEEIGKQLADEQYRQGADIIFHAAGQTGFGVFDSAVSNNLYAIGVDNDQSSYAPSNIIASVIKKVDVAVNNLTEQFLLGKLQAGQNYVYGIKDGGVDIVTHKYIVSSEIQNEIATLKNKIISGELKIEDLL